MQVSDGELCAFDVDGEVDFTATTEIFDVAVTTTMQLISAMVDPTS